MISYDKNTAIYNIILMSDFLGTLNNDTLNYKKWLFYLMFSIALIVIVEMKSLILMAFCVIARCGRVVRLSVF